MWSRPLAAAKRAASDVVAKDLTRSWSVTTDCRHPAARHSSAVVSSGFVVANPARDSARTSPQAVCVDPLPPAMGDATGVLGWEGASACVGVPPVAALLHPQRTAAANAAIADFANRAICTNFSVA